MGKMWTKRRGITRVNLNKLLVSEKCVYKSVNLESPSPCMNIMCEVWITIKDFPSSLIVLHHIRALFIVPIKHFFNACFFPSSSSFGSEIRNPFSIPFFFSVSFCVSILKQWLFSIELPNEKGTGHISQVHWVSLRYFFTLSSNGWDIELNDYFSSFFFSVKTVVK